MAEAPFWEWAMKNLGLSLIFLVGFIFALKRLLDLYERQLTAKDTMMQLQHSAHIETERGMTEALREVHKALSEINITLARRNGKP